MRLQDAFGRPIEYMRVSVTDRCNLRCLYCMPPKGIKTIESSEILRFEEIERVVRIATRIGFSRVRITGGEPLARKGIVDLVRALAKIEAVKDLSMTTNGILLGPYVPDLRKAGLQRVNISLDTLRSERYEHITRTGRLADALEGIRTAEEAGLGPIKLNAVIIKGINDDEIEDLARLTLDHPWHVRFIELMPFWSSCGCNAGSWADKVVPIENIRQRIVSIGAKKAETGRVPRGRGPASYLRLPKALGTLGFIGHEGLGFCYKCNRLRLTADGKVRPCLFSEHAVDLKSALRKGTTDDEIEGLIRKAVIEKPREGAEQVERIGTTETTPRALCEIGG